VTEILVAGLCSATVWIGFRSLGSRDVICARRLQALKTEPSARQVPPGLWILSLVRYVGRRFPGGKADSLRAAVAAAGLKDPDLFRGSQLTGMVAGVILGAATGSWSIFAAPVGAIVGFKLPSMFLTARVRRRRDEVALALPDIIDLLAVCTQAGLNIALSLRRVSEHAGGLLGQELRRTLDEIEMGVPRTKALQGLAERIRSDDLDALVGVLVSAERFGTQVSVALEAFAREVRGKRRRRAEEQARRAPVKILFPLVFLILPAFVLLTVVPLLLSTFASLGL
jgi:Flp pilus assembly protein TadB